MQNFFGERFSILPKMPSADPMGGVRHGKGVLEVEAESGSDFEITTDIIEDLRPGWTDFGE